MSYLYRVGGRPGRGRRAVFDGPAELPRVYVDTTYPNVTGATINVANGGDLQAAINAANPGDEIVLAPGATYSGNYTLPVKSGGGYTVIRTAGADTACPVGTRMTPTRAGTMNLATISSPNGAAAIATVAQSHHWWISRVAITSTTGSGNNGLVRFGQGETTLSDMPRYLVLDRCYVHGSSSLALQNAVLLQSIHNAVIDSWVSEVHWAGVESHGIVGWQGPGPFKVVNNYVDAASINFFYGGAPPIIAGLHPSDFEIRRNHFFKPLAYIGAGFAVKNLFELKHAVRVLAEGNFLENDWADSQTGLAVIFRAGADSGSDVVTSDITFRYNIIRNVTGAYNVIGADPPVPNLARICVHDNLAYDIKKVAPIDDTIIGAQFLNGTFGLRFVHNTMVLDQPDKSQRPFQPDLESGPQATGVVILDNLTGNGQSTGSIQGSAQLGINALNAFAGTDWAYHHNVLWNDAVAPPDARAVPNNSYAVDQAAIHFDTDWSLLNTSPYKNAASDGTDPGADIATLTTKTSGVVVAP